MTQANLLEQARGGDPSAIAALMNRTLKPKGITATVERVGDRLIVHLEAAQVPNRQAMTTFVQNGILGLKTQTIRDVEIHGRQIGSDRSAWVQEIQLGLVIDRESQDQGLGVEADSPKLDEPAIASDASRAQPPAPPPMRPAPPPIPRMQPPDPIAADAADGTDGDRLNVEPVTPIEPDPIASEVIAPIEPVPDPKPATLHAAVPPGEEIVTAERSQRRRSGLLLPLIVLALLSGLIGAIVGYALWRDRTAPNPDPILPPSPLPSATTPPPVSPAAPSPVSSTADPLEEAIAQQTQAERLARSAQSADDWSLVASQWQQSIDLLKSIPAGSPNYATAQTQLRQAQTQLASARDRASRPIASAPPPNTTFTVTREISCPTTATGRPDAQPVELSNIRFQGGDQIVGCITNNTNQPIAAVSIAYQGSTPAPAETPAPDATASPTATPATPQAGDSALSFSELAPQRTVPFSSSIALAPQASNITISAVNWTPAGASESQQLPVSVALPR